MKQCWGRWRNSTCCTVITYFFLYKLTTVFLLCSCHRRFAKRVYVALPDAEVFTAKPLTQHYDQWPLLALKCEWCSIFLSWSNSHPSRQDSLCWKIFWESRGIHWARMSCLLLPSEFCIYMPHYLHSISFVFTCINSWICNLIERLQDIQEVTSRR